MDSTLYKSYAGAAPVACVNGVAEVVPGDANNTFKCSNVSKLNLALHCNITQRTKITDRFLDRLL